MTAHLAVYSSPLVVSAAALVALLVITWRSRSDAAAPWFAATLVAFLVWTVGYAFEILAPTLGGKLWWAAFEFIGIALLPVAWFEVVRRYTGHGPLPRWASVLLGGYVGEEFVLLLPHLNEAEARDFAERLRQAVEALAVWKDEQLVTVTASVGLAGTGRATHEFLNDLLAPADSALRRAREAGGNQVILGEQAWGPLAGPPR